MSLELATQTELVGGHNRPPLLVANFALNQAVIEIAHATLRAGHFI
jgi:hypothetical protein